MKIAIYYPWIHLKSGVERTILESIKNSKNDYTVLTNHFDKQGTYPEFRNVKIVRLKNIPVKRNILSTLKGTIIIALQKVDLSGYDLLIIHSEGLGDLFLLRNNKIPAICYCHTPLRPVFDREYRKRAIQMRSLMRKAIYLVFDFVFKNIDRFLWRRYKYIIFNSKESLKRARLGGLIGKGAKYKILHPGVNWEKIKPTWKFEKYFLMPGRIMWTKNIELAIKAFHLFIKHNQNFKLIVAGMVDRKSKRYFDYLRILTKGTSNVKFIINPTDNEMRKLYSNCYCVLATSFNEDWGLTPIEANAFGKPVIAVNRGGYKESQKNGKTGFLLEPKPMLFANIIVKSSQ